MDSPYHQPTSNSRVCWVSSRKPFGEIADDHYSYCSQNRAQDASFVFRRTFAVCENDMPDDKYYVRIKQEAERWLFKLPGVRAVGLGPKFVAGRAIGKLAILVFVESKRALASVPSHEIIP